MKREIISAKDYYRSPQARELAHAVKDGCNDAIEQMAKQLTLYVPKDAVLIPVPSRHGIATDTKKIALLLQDMSQCGVLDIVIGHERSSLYEIKKQHRTVDRNFFGYHLSGRMSLGRPVILDVLIDTGLTAHSVAHLFHNPIILTHSRVV